MVSRYNSAMHGDMEAFPDGGYVRFEDYENERLNHEDDMKSFRVMRERVLNLARALPDEARSQWILACRRAGASCPCFCGAHISEVCNYPKKGAKE